MPKRTKLDGRFFDLQIDGDRAYQEDDYDQWDDRDIDGNEHALMLVADGMGGHVGGAIASKLVCETFVESYKQSYKLDSLPIEDRLHAGLVDKPRDPCPECGRACIADRLRYCLDKANAAIADKVAQKPPLKGMGTTLVAAVISQRGIEGISVGDSPMWLFSAGKLKRLNEDHSLVAEEVKKGHLSAEEAATDPRRHLLSSALTGDDIPKIDPPRRCRKTKCHVLSQPVEIKNGDLLLLASDGLMTLDEKDIASILQRTQDLKDKRKALNQAGEALIQKVEAKEHPYQDNTTVLLYTPEAKKSKPIKRWITRLLGL